MDVTKNSKSWDRVVKLQQGKVYIEVMTKDLGVRYAHPLRCLKGNLTSLIEMTHWEGSKVLYIGDHIYGDLAVGAS